MTSSSEGAGSVDVVDYVWNSTAGGGSAALWAHALNTPAMRDGLLRRAALSDQWEHLRRAAEHAAEEADRAGWSRAGPEVVSAICRWITADRLLRQVPEHDRAARLAAATLRAWGSPGEVAQLIAASPAPDQVAQDAFHGEVADDGHGLAGEVMAEVEAAMGNDPDEHNPDLVAFACNTDPIRRALLRDAARTGRWADLADAADDAAAAAGAAGTFDAGPRAIAAVSRWMLGHPGAGDELAGLRELDPLAGAVLDSGRTPLDLADTWAHSPRLDEATARDFDRAAGHALGGDPMDQTPGEYQTVGTEHRGAASAFIEADEGFHDPLGR